MLPFCATLAQRCRRHSNDAVDRTDGEQALAARKRERPCVLRALLVEARQQAARGKGRR
jgi:hypothetical protein